mmetsp:Transcript_5359/g.7118  ORF Transcript_5359/g.7118 Transcript_5359/m.7118 type:complete len:210 (-) Transcript_5359:54-683(-)
MEEMPEHFQLRYRGVLKSKDCIAKMLHYKGHDELMETITGERHESNFTLVHLLTNIGLGLHGSYGTDRQDILTFEEGLRSHFERTKSLRGMAPRLTPEAKQCILEYTQEFSCHGVSGVCGVGPASDEATENRKQQEERTKAASKLSFDSSHSSIDVSSTSARSDDDVNPSCNDRGDDDDGGDGDGGDTVVCAASLSTNKKGGVGRKTEQ